MSNSPQEPWSDGPYAPKIPYDLYFGEKATFAGILIGAILYGTICLCARLSVLTSFVTLGIVTMLFFQCMAAFLDPINRRRDGIMWGPVIYTFLTFSFVTIFTAMNLNIQSISFIDNREFPGVPDVLIPPGPFGYQLFIYSKVLSIVPNLMFLLNNWLADGLLVTFASNSLIQAPNAGCSSSSIVVTLSTP